MKKFLFGSSKPKDIELPNESGRRDKKLKKSKLDDIKEGFKIFKSFGEKK